MAKKKSVPPFESGKMERVEHAAGRKVGKGGKPVPAKKGKRGC